MIEIMIGIMTPIFIAIGKILYNRHKRLNYYYSIIWGESAYLNPEDILRERGQPKYGFLEYYYCREQDENIKKRIENGQNVLIIGNPLAGKSRAIYQALINLNGKYDVIVPNPVDIRPEDFEIPPRLSFWKIILVLDDLDKFAERQNFMHLLQEFLKRNVIIIASCRSGPEYTALRRKMERELCSIFDEPIEIQKLSKKEGEEIIKQTGKFLPLKFDGNIGSIFLPLSAMKNRFENSSIVEKGTLRSLKRLYCAGIFKEREIFSLRRIMKVCERKGIEMRDFEWEDLFRKLENNGFIEIINKDDIWIEETYLQTVIERNFSILDNFSEMIEIFFNDPEALISLGDRVFNIGFMDIQIIKYMKIANKAYEKALEFRNLKDHPIEYARIQNNLGNVYRELAEIENKAENCKKAITVYKKALKVRSAKKLLRDYAVTQNNIGAVYLTFAEVENRTENCKKAIIAFEEALETLNVKDFPSDFAMVQSNLGVAYGLLAEVENRAENCKKSITANKKVLEVSNPKEFPVDYSNAQNNLGLTYTYLAEVENKAENCKKAIIAFEEALKVRTLEERSLGYAQTKANIGIAYSQLAEVENKAENCKKAITIFEEVFEIQNVKDFPIQYAFNQINLGHVHGILAEVENKAENCKKAITLFVEALETLNVKGFPIHYAIIQMELGLMHKYFAEVENKAENCKKAIKFCEDALKVFSSEEYPIYYARTNEILGRAFENLAEVENRTQNCKKAIAAYKKALKGYKKENLTEHYEVVENTLRTLLET